MFKKIQKRDGLVVEFEPLKITEAILNAGKATSEFDLLEAEKLTSGVLEAAKQTLKKTIPTVEEIQDLVEEALLSSPYKKTAKAYILYRDQHTNIREIRTKGEVSLIDDYLKCLDWQVNENSNMSYSLQGLNNYVSSQITKTYWLHKIYPKEIRDAHTEGDLHIHDLQELSVYCVGWDLKDLLLSGFKGAAGKVESSPAKHFRTILGQVVNLFYTLQGEAAGAQALSNFDTLLAPFIYYDQLTYPEVKQAMQEFIFNLNVPTRVGFQTPFTNLTMDVEVPKLYADENVIIGGKLQKETYAQFQKEMNLLNQAFLEIMAQGDAKNRVFTFPIPTYNINKEFNWTNPVLKDLWTVAGRYGIPYFSNFINSDMSPDDARSMCCRLRLDNRQLKHRGGGLFGANPLTGSAGVVTINMARLGYENETEEQFFKRLDTLLELAKESLEIKRKVIEQYTEKGLYPYSKFYLRAIKQQTGHYWSNHFSTIGIIGMNEACVNFLGQNIASPEGKALAIRTMNHIRNKIQTFQKETGNFYNLEATPAEGTSYRLALLDKKRHPEIIVANEEDVKKGAEPFYTNSTHLPVNYTSDIFELLDHQDELQALYTGGTVVHTFAGEAIENPEAVKSFVKKVCYNYSLPYFTITPTFSICPSHGYLNGEHKQCLVCGSETETYSRVVGYLTPLNRWNKGKEEEFKIRKTFEIAPDTCL